MINQQTHLEGNQYGISSIGLSPRMVDTDMQGKIRASGINQVSKVRKEDLINSKKQDNSPYGVLQVMPMNFLGN